MEPDQRRIVYLPIVIRNMIQGGKSQASIGRLGGPTEEVSQVSPIHLNAGTESPPLDH